MRLETGYLNQGEGSGAKKLMGERKGGDQMRKQEGKVGENNSKLKREEVEARKEMKLETEWGIKSWKDRSG